MEWQKATELREGPNRFIGMRDFSYLNLGIQDLKQNQGEFRDGKYAREVGCQI